VLGGRPHSPLAAVTFMGPPIHCWFEATVEDGAEVRRMVLEGAPWKGHKRLVVWWRVPGVTDLPDVPVVDSLLAGRLLWAARQGRDLIVHGPLSRGGLYNLGQLLEMRRCWSPELYPRLIEIIPDSIVSPPLRDDGPRRAVAACSGGLDSTFTIVRHARRLLGDASHDLATLVMVHGFDACVAETDIFAAMRRRMEPLAASLGLPLHTVVTNSKELPGSAWPHSAIPLTAAALSLFSGRHAIGLVSAGAPYGIARFGTSHPGISDGLLTNDWFTVVSDGGGFGRADKVETLLPYPEAFERVKVCWEGDDPSKNCGRCQKCVLTRLNFLAAGWPDPPCFDTPLEASHVAALRLPSMTAAKDLFRMGLNELEARGVGGPIVDLLRRRLARVPPDWSLAAWWLTPRARRGRRPAAAASPPAPPAGRAADQRRNGS